MFHNKNVVVTGAGRGIGRALALTFAEQGANVLVHYGHAEQEAEEVVRQINEAGGRAMLAQADLSRPEGSISSRYPGIYNVGTYRCLDQQCRGKC